MRDEVDYYTILGVPRGASEVEIRRAFRSLAKALHPDSKQAGTEPSPDYDFSILTEAYETLRDESRRRAYDRYLNGARQLATEAGKQRHPRAFTAGLAIGIFFAVVAVGATIYLDRNGFRAGGPKSQESLRVHSADGNASQEATADVPSATKDDVRPSPVIALPPSPPAARPARLSKDAGQTGTQPGVTSKGPDVALPSKDTGGQRLAGTMETPLAKPVVSIPPSVVVKPADASLSGSRQAQDVNAHHFNAPSAFTQSVLTLERTINGGGDGIAAYRLVSLVSSATNIEDLSQAIEAVNRPETRDLINSRIDELKRSQNRPASWESWAHTANGGENPAPPQDGASMGRARVAEANIVEFTVGMKTNETVLRLNLAHGRPESFSDCASCPQMVVIPGGQAAVGSRPSRDGYRAEEIPVQRTYPRKAFAVSKHGISVGNWRACVEAGACRPALSSLLAIGPRVPMTRVSWYDAKAYVEWLSQATGRRYRLLSEAEWEYAVRTSPRRGPSPATVARPDNAAFESAGDAGALGFRARLGRANGAVPNAWGVNAMGANFQEWVEDCWRGHYNETPSNASAWQPGPGSDCTYRVVRGNTGFGSEYGERRLPARDREYADSRAPTLGFRVAREIIAPTKTALEVR